VHEDELNRALKAAVPGLMTDATASASASAVVVNGGSDRYGGGRTGLGGTHKALVHADAFNVSVLFGPTLAFLERVKEIMPGGLMGDDDSSNGFGGFLDEFVLRTFLPQLEEKVSTVFHQAVGGQS
jgi:exocyst complex component 4